MTHNQMEKLALTIIADCVEVKERIVRIRKKLARIDQALSKRRR